MTSHTMERSREVTEENNADGIDDDEKAIQFCLEAFFEYIASCLSWKDLHFSKLFNDDDRRRFSAIQGPNDRTKQMLCHILQGIDDSRRFQILVMELEATGNTKVVSILKGRKVPTVSRNRKLIAKFGDHICRNLIPLDVLPRLVAKGVIDDVDSDRIRQKLKGSGKWEATLELLFVLPNKNLNWFDVFMTTLLKTKHISLAAAIADHKRRTSCKGAATALADATDTNLYDDDTLSVMSGHSGASVQTISECNRTHAECSTHQVFAKKESTCCKCDPRALERIEANLEKLTNVVMSHLNKRPTLEQRTKSKTMHQHGERSHYSRSTPGNGQRHTYPALFEKVSQRKVGRRTHAMPTIKEGDTQTKPDRGMPKLTLLTEPELDDTSLPHFDCLETPEHSYANINQCKDSEKQSLVEEWVRQHSKDGEDKTEQMKLRMNAINTQTCYEQKMTITASKDSSKLETQMNPRSATVVPLLNRFIRLPDSQPPADTEINKPVKVKMETESRSNQNQQINVKQTGDIHASCTSSVVITSGIFHQATTTMKSDNESKKDNYTNDGCHVEPSVRIAKNKTLTTEVDGSLSAGDDCKRNSSQTCACTEGQCIGSSKIVGHSSNDSTTKNEAIKRLDEDSNIRNIDVVVQHANEMNTSKKCRDMSEDTRIGTSFLSDVIASDGVNKDEEGNMAVIDNRDVDHNVSERGKTAIADQSTVLQNNAWSDCDSVHMLEENKSSETADECSTFRTDNVEKINAVAVVTGNEPGQKHDDTNKMKGSNCNGRNKEDTPKQDLVKHVGNGSDPETKGYGCGSAPFVTMTNSQSTIKYEHDENATMSKEFNGIDSFGADKACYGTNELTDLAKSVDLSARENDSAPERERGIEGSSLLFNSTAQFMITSPRPIVDTTGLKLGLRMQERERMWNKRNLKRFCRRNSKDTQ